MAAGSFSLRNYAEFSKTIKSFTPLTEIRVVKKEGSKIYLVLIYLKEQNKLVLDTLHKYSFNKFTFHAVPRKPTDEIAALEKELKEVENEEANLALKAKDLARDVAFLQIIYDLLKQRVDQLGITQKFGRTEASFVIEGWVAAKGFESLKKSLEKKIPEAEIVKIEPERGEVPPVATSNPKLLKPFEFITQLYGLPNYDEIDPTSALAGFFIIFFAICLTDAGYGIILAVLSWLALKKLDLGEGGRKFFRLLLLGGIVTFFVGAITGGWFGFELEKLPAIFGPLKSALIKVKLFDPMKNILGMLVFSLLLGLIHVIFGILISCYEKIRAKDIISAIFDDLSWVYFILSLVFLGVTKSMPSFSSFSKLASYLSLSGAVLIVLAQGRAEKNIIMKLVVGLYKLYNLTSYFGNVLSYSRLLALALTSTGIAMAINTVCGIVTGIPYVGYIVMVAVWIFGHTFNLVLSVLSAFIHSMRLQYVEFYLQFFKGGGRAFKPFKVETEYIKLT
ncbi:MAG: V-type ATPase 116kDa subunit family protein [bacterium]